MRSSTSASLRCRLERLTKPAGKTRVIRGDRGELARETAQHQIRDHPDLLKVEPCDTDPVTYASIRGTIAHAQGNERERRYWENQVPKPYQECSTLKEMLNLLHTELKQRTRATGLALESARRRLGIAVNPEERDVALRAMRDRGVPVSEGGH